MPRYAAARSVNDRPSVDWYGFMAAFEKAEERAASHVWLAAWRDEKPKRAIRVEFFGAAHDGKTLEALGAWQHAGFRGESQYEIILLEEGKPMAKVLLGAEEERAIIVMLMDKPGDLFPLIRFRPSQSVPHYMAVDRDGTLHPNKRPK